MHVCCCCLYKAPKIIFKISLFNLSENNSSFQPPDKLAKTWIHDIDFIFQVSRFASNVIKEITSCFGIQKHHWLKFQLCCNFLKWSFQATMFNKKKTTSKKARGHNHFLGYVQGHFLAWGPSRSPTFRDRTEDYRKKRDWIWNYTRIQEKSKFKGRVKISVTSHIYKFVCPRIPSMVTTDPYRSSTTTILPPRHWKTIASVCPFATKLSCVFAHCPHLPLPCSQPSLFLWCCPADIRQTIYFSAFATSSFKFLGDFIFQIFLITLCLSLANKDT